MWCKMHSKIRVSIIFILILIFVVLLSFFSTKIWGGKPEEIPDKIDITYNENMSIADFGKQNNLSNPVLKKIFKLSSPQDLNNKITTTD